MNNLGCSFLEEGIDFEPQKICDCCISHTDGRGLPVLIKDYEGEPVDWEKLFEIKAQKIKQQQEKTIFDCEGCYRLGEYTFKGEKKISEFHMSHCRICNAKCIYCSDEFSRSSLNYDTYPIIKDLFDKGYYKPGGEATFEGGEPTLMKSFNELVEFFVINGTRVRIHTSCITYSALVEDALKKNMGTVVVSLDSASKKTYAKIKLVDKFNIVVENLKKYASASNNNPDGIVVKYIIIPGVNDNIFEIDRFFKLMKQIGIKTVAVDIEVRYARAYNNKNVSPHIYILYDYFEKQAKLYNMKLLVYSFISYVIKNRTFNVPVNINNKISLFLNINKYNEKNKNISYYRK